LNFIQKGIANWLGYDRFVNPIYFERYSSQFVDPVTDYTEFSDDIRKLEVVFSNPAALKVFQISCNMFSMAKPFAYKDDVEQKNDPFVNWLKKPNPMQQRNQWLWDYKFWKMIGNAYGYANSHIAGNSNLKMYWLDSSKITMPVEMQDMRDKIILSAANETKINNFNIQYTYKDGSKTQFRWGDIAHIPDLTNGVGNWFKGPSRIDALYKVVSNSEAALDSKNINVRYAGKFIVAGKTDTNDVSKIPMGETEKTDVEQKMNGRKNVHAMKSLVDIKRFVENASIVGELDDSYLNDYFVIGSLYDIPKDVLEALNSSTFENQEKGRGAFVDYCLTPDAEQLSSSLESFFNYDKNIIFDWSHLSFMQVFAKDRADVNYKNTQSLLNLMKAGVEIDEINRILDTKFSKLDYDRAERSGQSAQTGGNQEQNQE